MASARLASKSHNGFDDPLLVNVKPDLSTPKIGSFDLKEKFKAASVERVKRKAKRTTRSVDLAEDLVDRTGVLSASLPSHFTFSHYMSRSWARKNSKNARKSRRGRGLAKKQGAGGKGTWGSLVDVEESFDDGYDLNYESDNQENCEYVEIILPLSDEEVERHVTAAVTEYYEHGDTEETLAQLNEYNFDGKRHQVAIVAIALAMEQKSSNRELTSVLLSDFYGYFFKAEDYERAFSELINMLPELVLDTPEAATVLGNFMARAVGDDCLPPRFIEEFKARPDMTEIAKKCLEHASVLLGLKHGLMKLDTVWGIGGGMRPVNALISRIQLLLQEYISSEDVQEACVCLKELEVPHFHHELVYEAVICAIESMEHRTLNLITELLEFMIKTGIITIDQLLNGFERVFEEMPDIVLDIPLAYSLLEKLVTKCDKKGFMPKKVVDSLPSRGRKRFVSEGDGGRFKEI